MKAYLRIGEAARLAGVSAKTIRYYHQIGVLAEPRRSEAGYRLYDVEHLIRLRQIRKLQQLGLSLRQIREVPQETPDVPSLRGTLEKILEETDTRIRTLRKRREMIARMLGDGESSRGIPAMMQKLISKLPQDLLGQISPEAWNLEREIWAALEGFNWPEGYEQALMDIADAVSANPGQHARLIRLGERVAALDDAPNAPDEAATIRAELGQLERECPELIAALGVLLPRGTKTSHVWGELVLSAMTETQRKLALGELADETGTGRVEDDVEA